MKNLILSAFASLMLIGLPAVAADAAKTGDNAKMEDAKGKKTMTAAEKKKAEDEKKAKAAKK